MPRRARLVASADALTRQAVLKACGTRGGALVLHYRRRSALIGSQQLNVARRVGASADALTRRAVLRPLVQPGEDGPFLSATATADGHASTPSSSSSDCRWHRQRASPEGRLGGPTHAAVFLRYKSAFGTLWAFWAAEVTPSPTTDSSPDGLQRRARGCRGETAQRFVLVWAITPASGRRRGAGPAGRPSVPR